MEHIRWERLAAIVICVTAGIALIWWGGRLVLSFALPFVLAWLLSLCVTPLSEKIAKKLRLPPKICAIVLLTLILSATVFLIGASVNRVLLELQKLLTRLLENGNFPDAVISDSFDYFEKVASGIGIFERIGSAERYAVIREKFNQAVNDLIGNLISALSAWLPAAAGKLISSLPSVLLFTVVTVIAGFYFCTDRKRIEGAVIALLPGIIRKHLPEWQSDAKRISWRYVRAYLFLLFLTFAELFLGLSVLRIDYAFLLALLIALVDLLPILGVGTVLVPWAVVELLRKDFYIGFGLLILYLAVTVIRQIIEPKLIGKTLGLHPLLTLISGYAGWKCFGILGMALAPVVVMVIRNIFKGRVPAEGEHGKEANR